MRLDNEKHKKSWLQTFEELVDAHNQYADPNYNPLEGVEIVVDTTKKGK